MTTAYPEREHEFDLGDGHSFVWFYDSEGLFGLIEHHPPGPDAPPGTPYCGGYIAWRSSSSRPPAFPKHQIIAGGEGDEEHLTIAPSLACRTCESHGWIRGGKWVDA